MTKRKTKTLAPKEVTIQIDEAFGKEGSDASLAVREPVIPIVVEREDESDKFIKALANEEIKDKKQKRATKRKHGDAHVGMSNKVFWFTVGAYAFVGLVIILLGLGYLVLPEDVVLGLIVLSGLPAIIKSFSDWFKPPKDE